MRRTVEEVRQQQSQMHAAQVQMHAAQVQLTAKVDAVLAALASTEAPPADGSLARQSRVPSGLD